MAPTRESEHEMTDHEFATNPSPRAHSKSEYKRLIAQGVQAEPPEFMTPAETNPITPEELATRSGCSQLRAAAFLDICSRDGARHFIASDGQITAFGIWATGKANQLATGVRDTNAYINMKARGK